MPFKLFSRKSSRRTTVEKLKHTSDDAHSLSSGTSSPSNGGLPHSTSSASLAVAGAAGRPQLGNRTASRSASLYSFRTDRASSTPVPADELVNGFHKADIVPASRRMPSSSGGSIAGRTPSNAGSREGSVRSRTGQAPVSPLTSSYTMVEHPQPTAGPSSKPAAASSATVSTGLSQLVEDTGNSSEDDDDADQTYESPEEFSDTELAAIAASPTTPGLVNASRFEGSGILSPGRTQHNTHNPPAQTSQDIQDSLDRAKAHSIPDPSENPLRADIRQIWYAISLFLNSQMVAAEELLAPKANERMYYALGFGMITTMKALMSFEPADLAFASENCKTCLALAIAEKNKWPTGGKGLSWSERITGGVGGVVKGSSLTVDQVQRMSMEQRHAELAYAEGLLLKAIVTLFYAGDFLAFIREALNMRTSSASYRVLSRFLKVADAAHPDGFDPSLDLDFRSGVDFGMASMSLILSLLPSSAIRIMEIFGFSGDREEALAGLMKTGGWTKTGRDPNISEGPGKEGIRAVVCDLTLLMYHLIISSFLPTSDVDIDLADRILHYNLNRYPQGVFWLYFSGRLYSTQTLGKKAIQQYNQAINAQKEYRQIQHICNWDLAITYLSLGQYALAHDNLEILEKESNWSKAAYAYGTAITLYETLESVPVADQEAPTSPTHNKAENDKRQHIADVMHTIPGHLKKIAGKSLPFEKFVARKSKKYLAQDGHLCLPGLEFAYVLNSLVLAPRYALFGTHLLEIDNVLAKLREKHDPNSSSNAPNGWWDDYCLANFMRGVVLHLIIFPEKHIKLDPPESPLPIAEASQQALDAFRVVLDNSLKLELDHHIAYFAHYEYARLLAKTGKEHQADARKHLSLVLDGKVPLGPTKGKGKVSLHNMVVLRANAAMDQLKTV